MAGLTETIKALLEVAREQNYLTYDDINDVLPDGVSPNDLEALYTRLDNLGIKIVTHSEAEKAEPEEPDRRKTADSMPWTTPFGCI